MDVAQFNIENNSGKNYVVKAPTIIVFVYDSYNFGRKNPDLFSENVGVNVATD